MKCPFCSNDDSRVTDSRLVNESNVIKRRRECIKCNKRFTTFETVDISLQIKKRNGIFQDFDKKKLIKGLDAACSHTKINHDQIREFVNKMTLGLMKNQIRTISSNELGEMVINYLKENDVIAYIRFFCVYKRIKCLDQLMNAIKSIDSLNFK